MRRLQRAASFGKHAQLPTAENFVISPPRRRSASPAPPLARLKRSTTLCRVGTAAAATDEKKLRAFGRLIRRRISLPLLAPRSTGDYVFLESTFNMAHPRFSTMTTAGLDVALVLGIGNVKTCARS
jgi:hypothetical protein